MSSLDNNKKQPEMFIEVNYEKKTIEKTLTTLKDLTTKNSINNQEKPFLEKVKNFFNNFFEFNDYVKRRKMRFYQKDNLNQNNDLYSTIFYISLIAFGFGFIYFVYFLYSKKSKQDPNRSITIETREENKEFDLPLLKSP